MSDPTPIGREWLTSADVADLMGWTTLSTVHRRLADTRRKERNGETLRGIDFPAPSHYDMATPKWPRRQIDAYISARAARRDAPRTARREIVARKAGEITPGMMVIFGASQYEVRRVRRIADGALQFLISPRSRDPGRWTLSSYPPDMPLPTRREKS
jgi:hypothetical protein